MYSLKDEHSNAMKRHSFTKEHSNALKTTLKLPVVQLVNFIRVEIFTWKGSTTTQYTEADAHLDRDII